MTDEFQKEVISFMKKHGVTNYVLFTKMKDGFMYCESAISSDNPEFEQFRVVSSAVFSLIVTGSAPDSSSVETEFPNQVN